MLANLVVVLATIGAVYGIPHWHQGKIIYDTPQSEKVSAVVEDQYERFLLQDLDHFDRHEWQKRRR